METVIIVGASHAATDLIASLRKLGWVDKIVLIGDEPTLPYQRPPLSKAYCKGELPAEKLLIRPTSFYEKNKVDLHLNKRVTQIHREDKSVVLENGERLSYTYLVLATGTRPRPLPIEGSDLPGINYLRTQRDVDAIKAHLTPGSKLLIIGAGYIGLEVAASAVKLGVHVVVFEAMDRVLARVTSPQVSEFYQSLHAQEGVDIRLKSSVSKIEKLDQGLQATANENETIGFDSAIIGIGVVPNTELAEQADLDCENGIKVNAYTQTNDPNIFAIGDCSFHHNPFYDRWVRLESVPNAVEQAKVAAAKICGNEVVYNQLPWFWSDQYDVKLQTAGLFNDYDEVVIRGDMKNRKFAAFYLSDDRLIAVDAINSPAEFMISKKLILARTTIDKTRLANSDVPIKELLD